MTTEGTETSRSVPETVQLTTVEVIDRLSRYEGPPQQFLAHLLAVQCQIGAASGGAILRSGPEGVVDILAAYPALSQSAPLPVWLAMAVESFTEILSANATIVKSLHSPEDLYGQPPSRHLIMVPLRSSAEVRTLSVFLVETRDVNVVVASRDRLELTASLLSLYEMRLMLQKRQMDLRRFRQAMETLAAVNEHEEFAGLAMSLCNEIASRWQCDRVSVGFLKGRYVKMRAMSHTENFSRKMKVVQDVEAAMEECVDQDIEVYFPASPEVTFISRAAGELSRQHGPLAVLSLPLRRGGKAVAVLTLERPADKQFTVEEVEALRLMADLVTPRLAALEEHDRWIGGRLVQDIRKLAAVAVGPKHTWIKLAVIVIAGILLFAFLVNGEYRVEAPFVLEPIEAQVVPAPFDGFIEKVNVLPGDTVEGGKTVLATLDTIELRLRLASAKAERLAYQKQAAAAAGEDKTAEAQIAMAQADRIAAQIDILQFQIDRAAITSPISGVVTLGDLKRQIGAPTKLGETLFEVAPLEALRADLSVTNDEVADVGVGQEGELATASYPDQRIAFVVERINPMSEVVEKENVFKVRVRLKSTPLWMRPGMEGLAKVDAGEHCYAWIWSRKAINWVRMKLWL